MALASRYGRANPPPRRRSTAAWRRLTLQPVAGWRHAARTRRPVLPSACGGGAFIIRCGGDVGVFAYIFINALSRAHDRGEKRVSTHHAASTWLAGGGGATAGVRTPPFCAQKSFHRGKNWFCLAHHFVSTYISRRALQRQRQQHAAAAAGRFSAASRWRALRCIAQPHALYSQQYAFAARRHGVYRTRAYSHHARGAAPHRHPRGGRQADSENIRSRAGGTRRALIDRHRDIFGSFVFSRYAFRLCRFLGATLRASSGRRQTCR